MAIHKITPNKIYFFHKDYFYKYTYSVQTILQLIFQLILESLQNLYTGLYIYINHLSLSDAAKLSLSLGIYH